MNTIICSNKDIDYLGPCEGVIIFYKYNATNNYFSKCLRHFEKMRQDNEDLMISEVSESEYVTVMVINS